MNADFLVPTKSAGSYRFFVEVDLFGTNATTPRPRHAYGQAKNFLVGQTFSNFMDPDAGPDQLDFQGPNAQVSIRSPQFRYSHPCPASKATRPLRQHSRRIAGSLPHAFVPVSKNNKLRVLGGQIRSKLRSHRRGCITGHSTTGHSTVTSRLTVDRGQL
jgi:hypothetical protein